MEFRQSRVSRSVWVNFLNFLGVYWASCDFFGVQTIMQYWAQLNLKGGLKFLPVEKENYAKKMPCYKYYILSNVFVGKGSKKNS